jgi:hypothetical protein
MIRKHILKLLLLSTAAALARGQTQIDLQHQARGIDFTAASYTKPLQLGTSLPATCMIGQAFMMTGGAAGSNLYFCLSNNEWTLEGGSGSSGPATGLSTLSSSTSGPILTIGALCSISLPCNVRFGATVYAITSPATATLTAGTGTAYVYVSSSGVLTVGHNLTLSCASVCTAASGVTAFPNDSTPLAIWTANAGTWTNGVDVRSAFGRDDVYASTGLISVQSQGLSTLSVDFSVVTRTIASGTASLGASAISSAVCASVVTVAATSVASTDAVIWTPNASLKTITGYAPSTSGGLSISAYPTNGNVNFDVCNWSGGSITPGAVTLNWRVVR